MPAGKSPNNAFNLHNDRMKRVFRSIRGEDLDDYEVWLLENYPQCHHSRIRRKFQQDALNILDRSLSQPVFYWKEQFRIKYLFTKGYTNQDIQCIYLPGPITRGRSQARISLLITKVREYYTDGVRGIGAME